MVEGSKIDSWVKAKVMVTTKKVDIRIEEVTITIKEEDIKTTEVTTSMTSNRSNKTKSRNNLILHLEKESHLSLDLVRAPKKLRVRITELSLIIQSKPNKIIELFIKKNQNPSNRSPSNPPGKFSFSLKVSKTKITSVKANIKATEEVIIKRVVDILRAVEATEVETINKDRTITMKVKREIMEEAYIIVKVINMDKETLTISKDISNSNNSMRVKKKENMKMSINQREEAEVEEADTLRKTITIKMWNTNLITTMILDLKVKDTF
jgi:hypothetical protein